MRAVKKVSSKLLILCIIFIMCLSITAIQVANKDSVAFADSSEINININDVCQDLTASIEFTIDDEKHDLTEYEEYLNKRFQITNMNNTDTKISDEWISSIVPIQLFEQQAQNFLYIGEAYGFYFNYNEIEDRYLIYFMLHNLDCESVSGHIIRKITPFYYEKYRYNRETGVVSLEYKVKEVRNDQTGETTILKYYGKYSNAKNVYLKNVGFTGTLYNLNSLNIGDDRYNAIQDNGGYFIGGGYKFKGVSTQSGKMDFCSDMFMIALGIFGGPEVSVALTVKDVLIAIMNGVEDEKKDFREDLTNENDYSYKIIDIERETQVQKYNHLLKDYVSILDTPDDKDGVLFGIKRDSYIQSTFYYNFANQIDKANTGLVSKIKMDIVEEDFNLTGSKVIHIASGCRIK